MLAVDPHDRLPFAMVWSYLTPWGDYIIDHEWPTEPFESIRSHSYTYWDYARVIGEHPRAQWRVMDPNFGRKRIGATGRTVSEEMAMRSSADNPLYFDTRVVDDLQAGHASVAELLRYDKSQPVSNENSPKLFIKKRCRNVLTGFKYYTWDDYRGSLGDSKEPKQKPKEKYKHFPDCVRYMAMYPIKYNLKKDGEVRVPLPDDLARSWDRLRKPNGSPTASSRGHPEGRATN